MGLTKLEFKDGDDGGEFEPAEHIAISMAENGYLVTVSFVEEVYQYVYNDSDKMLKEIRKFV